MRLTKMDYSSIRVKAGDITNVCSVDEDTCTQVVLKSGKVLLVHEQVEYIEKLVAVRKGSA